LPLLSLFYFLLFFTFSLPFNSPDFFPAFFSPFLFLSFRETISEEPQLATQNDKKQGTPSTKQNLTSTKQKEEKVVPEVAKKKPRRKGNAKQKKISVNLETQQNEQRIAGEKKLRNEEVDLKEERPKKRARVSVTNKQNEVEKPLREKEIKVATPNKSTPEKVKSTSPCSSVANLPFQQAERSATPPMKENKSASPAKKTPIEKQNNNKALQQRTPTSAEETNFVVPTSCVKNMDVKKQLSKKPITPAISPCTFSLACFICFIYLSILDSKINRNKQVNMISPQKSVNFSDVSVRFHNRRHGGSGGIPSRGGFPLGLDWTFESEIKSPIAVYEKKRIADGKGDDFEPVPEVERKRLLEAFDDRPAMARMVSYMNKKEELEEMRKERKDVGCNCRLKTEGKTADKYFCFFPFL
jgi:hypothetical protein